MENFDQPLDVGMDASAPSDGLQITQEVRMYWAQIAKWALFFAVLLFILFGLLALFGLIAALTGGAMGILGAIFIIGIYGVLLFFPALYYYRFSTQMKQALLNDDTALLDEAFANLRRYYNFVGILVIVVLALYVIMFVVFGAALMRGGLPTE